jgi:hypothetical protein
MIRGSLDPGSQHVILDVKPDGAYEFMTRSTPGGDTRFVAGGSFDGQASQMRLIRGAWPTSFPIYLKGS